VVLVPGGVLEEIPLPPQVLWDDRPLYELRLRLAADEDQRQRRQMAQQANPHPGRATYGGGAPLAVVPPQNPAPKDGTWGVYRPEVERLDALIRQERATANDFYLRGLICYEVGRYAEAARDFDAALRLAGRPRHDWLAMRGLAALAAGNAEAARRDLDEAVRLDANVRNLNNRGAALLALGRGKEALEDFERALAIRQFLVKVTTVFINRARAQSDLGNHAEAIEQLKTLTNGSLDPEAVMAANYLRGMVHRRMGEYAWSGRCYDLVLQVQRTENVQAHGMPTGTAIKKMPTDATLLDTLMGEETGAEALVGRGIAHAQLGHTGPAIQDYSKALRLRPELVQALVNRAVAYVQQGDVDLAEMDLEDALKLNPHCASAWFNRGRLRLLQGKDAEGQADLQRAAELAPVLKARADKLEEEVRKARQAAPTEPAAPAAPPYRAATPEEAIAWLQNARKADDQEAILQALANPIGPLFRKLYKTAERADQAHKRYMEVRNRQSGNFSDPSQWPININTEEMRRLREQQKFVVQSMTILKKEPPDPQAAVVQLTVRTIKTNALRERQTPLEVYIAVRQGENWKLMTKSMVELTDEEQKLIKEYFHQQTLRVNQMRKIMEDATRLRLAGKPVNELQVALALMQVYKDYQLPGKTGDEPKSLEQVILECSLMMGPYSQGLQQLYLYNRAMQGVGPQQGGPRP
jgi:tetratricopeptide (TPR) repeat protein